MSTNSDGLVTFPSEMIDRNVEITVIDEDGVPLQGMMSRWASLNDAYYIVVEDPAGVYAPAMVFDIAPMVQVESPRAVAPPLLKSESNDFLSRVLHMYRYVSDSEYRDFKDVSFEGNPESLCHLSTSDLSVYVTSYADAFEQWWFAAADSGLSPLLGLGRGIEEGASVLFESLSFVSLTPDREALLELSLARQRVETGRSDLTRDTQVVYLAYELPGEYLGGLFIPPEGISANTWALAICKGDVSVNGDCTDPQLTINRLADLPPVAEPGEMVSAEFDWSLYSGDYQPGDPIWIAIYGWRDAAGNAVEPEPVQFYSGSPGTCPGHSEADETILISVRIAWGTYTLWVHAFPSTDVGEAISEFQRLRITASTNVAKDIGSVAVQGSGADFASSDYPNSQIDRINSDCIYESKASQALTPDGSYMYVSSYWGGEVCVFRTTDNAWVNTIETRVHPTDLTMSPSGGYLYVVHTYSYLSVISTSTNAVETLIDLSGDHSALAMSPIGDFVYVASRRGGSLDAVLYAIRATDNSVAAAIPLGFPDYLGGIAIAPDGRYVYVVVSVVEGGTNANGTVDVVETSARTVVASIPVGWRPTQIAMAPDGLHAYVVNRGDGTVSIIDTQGRRVARVVSIPSPSGIAVAPDGTYVYVSIADYDGLHEGIAVVRTDDNEVVEVIPVYGVAKRIAFAPDGRKAYVVVDHESSGRFYSDVYVLGFGVDVGGR